MVQAIEHIPSKCETLVQTLVPPKEKKINGASDKGEAQLIHQHMHNGSRKRERKTTENVFEDCFYIVA
jgi:hypothetical protein